MNRKTISIFIINGIIDRWIFFLTLLILVLTLPSLLKSANLPDLGNFNTEISNTLPIDNGLTCTAFCNKEGVVIILSKEAIPLSITLFDNTGKCYQTSKNIIATTRVKEYFWNYKSAIGTNVKPGLYFFKLDSSVGCFKGRIFIK